MNILVINAGSSSIKADVIDPHTGRKSVEMQLERILSAQPLLRFSDEDTPRTCDGPGHEAALRCALPLLREKLGAVGIEAVGHRVVHGGERFDQAVRIDDTVVAGIAELNPVAPLHNPINLQVIRIARELLSDVPHVAVFDTAFHQTLPRRARTYALPKYLREKWGLRRYGFHGTSHQYVMQQAADFLSADPRELRLITCHLGNGASVAAIEYGRSVETSMGMTPLEGLVMGTRSGDVDPGLLIQLARDERMSLDDLDRVLNKESGLKGLSDRGNDLRDILEGASAGDDDCRLALHVLTHRLRKYIGAYAAVMGGVDAIVFTGGIGENSPVVRHRASQRLDFLGAIINEDKNRDVRLSDQAPVADFAMLHSRVRLLAVRTDEQLAIARQAAKLMLGKNEVNRVPQIPIAISARHVHLTQASVEKLFGTGYQLTEMRPLSQPGQFAANERVTLVGPRNRIENVRILGPARPYDQVEISRTDEFFLGIDAPVRESGKTKNTPGLTLIGPAGKLDLEEGVICAWRHIHMTPDDATTFGVGDRDIVEVTIGASERALTFKNVLVRVAPASKLEMHIDTDEGNAAQIQTGVTGTLTDTDETATLNRRRVQHDVV
ncbi:MAG: acetate/propionate family kinase [Catalinimonas sp.]